MGLGAPRGAFLSLTPRACLRPRSPAAGARAPWPLVHGGGLREQASSRPILSQGNCESGSQLVPLLGPRR